MKLATYILVATLTLTPLLVQADDAVKHTSQDIPGVKAQGQNNSNFQSILCHKYMLALLPRISSE